ncbi:MAG TPA: nucleoside recognition domain-containing protein [Chitinophagaceae bacterium]|nr:nucleoside recognition domain-containing protein [Chitinophagaceae bacterium]
MALSRIWSAFIVVSVLVAAYHWLAGGDQGIFSRMVTGKADDPYDSVACLLIGSPREAGFTSREGFEKFIGGYGYYPVTSPGRAQVLVADRVTLDSVRLMKQANPGLQVYDYRTIQYRLSRRADGIIETCKSAVTISLGLIGMLALFMGFLSIAERAGGVRFLSRIVGPFFSRVFPDIPKGHPAMGHMIMNFSANLLNLDNAATPFAIRAMESLQELNPDKERASNSQIMFLCLHAAGLTLIPVTIIAARSALKAQSPIDIFVPCLIVTFVATVAALLIVGLKQKINLFQPVILAWIGGISALIALLVVYLHRLNAGQVQIFSGLLGNGLLVLILLLIVAGGLYKGVPIFDAFVEGARGGFETAVRIIPYLVGLLVAISMLRTSGAFDFLINGLKQLFVAMGTDTRFVDGLPTALIRPLSGAGGRGMMIDTMKNFGPDSFAGRLACILQSSSDTTFYVVAVYFGAVGIKNTRYAVGAMLLADLVGILTAILMAYLFFGAVA